MQAIRCDNPVIFFEHVLLYNVKGEVEDSDYCQPLERAEVVRKGTDVSIFTYSRMRYVVMQAVQELEKKGYNPEVRGSGARLVCKDAKVDMQRVESIWVHIRQGWQHCDLLLLSAQRAGFMNTAGV